WQAHLIYKILEGFDTMCLAGTGYGKSIVFEGLAAMEKAKVVIVICPLKALERDQVAQARTKRLRAVAINEDTVKTRSIWADVMTGKYQLVYISPEMALSRSFEALWDNIKFREKISAIIVDEAHCADEWADEFREKYKELNRLRVYTGLEIPFCSFTATAGSKTFDVLWERFGYGSRPFWGVDTISNDTRLSDIPKCLFYFDSIAECTDAVSTLRRCLPESLRACVQGFYSTLSELAKGQRWDGFLVGTIRIICATDAAGMGCNVPDVVYSVIFGIPRSLSVVAQRWGRAGRD
ncbi:P-loop containing nucleoside triphosphate hydrolase protein, partial [Rickenella mellea]